MYICTISYIAHIIYFVSVTEKIIIEVTLKGLIFDLLNEIVLVCVGIIQLFLVYFTHRLPYTKMMQTWLLLFIVFIYIF